jgi:O-antigen/teichoic acid export membrane protein
MASMLFVFLCFPIGALLNACDQQKRHTINMGITALASVILNFLLIPFLSYNGAAIANLASYIILFILGLMVVNRITPYDKKYLLWSSMKILLACITMFAVVWIIKIEFNFVAAVIAGVIVYLILAYLLKIFSIRAIKEFIGSLRKGAAKNNIETEEIL